MKRLLFLALFVLAAWYGWHHYRELLDRQPKSEAVLVNQAGETLTRIRLTVGGKTYVKEELATGESATIKFPVSGDSQFDLLWEYAARQDESHWRGGSVARGPFASRYVFHLQAGGGVVYEPQRITAASSP